MLLLSIAIRDFLSHCRIEKNLSPKTRKAYSTDLLQLNDFLRLKSYPQDLTLVSKIELREYIDSMSNLKPKSIKRKIATIKALFNYLEYEDQIASNPFRKMRINIKECWQLPIVMDIKDISKIFKTAYSKMDLSLDRNGQAYRQILMNIIVIELLFATGGRVSEIANLKSEAVDLESGTITIFGKGNKERIIQICNPDSLEVLRQYKKMNQKFIEEAGYFLINRLKRKLSDQSIRFMVRKLGVSSSLIMRVTPHMFRHSFATLLLEQEVDIKYIQSLLGHSSITTTQIYTHVNKEKQRQILLEKHPRKNILV